MNPRTVRQARVQGWRFLGDTAADALSDVMNRGLKGIFAGKARLDFFQHALTLYENFGRAINENFSNRFITEKRQNGAEETLNGGYEYVVAFDHHHFGSDVMALLICAGGMAGLPKTTT